MPGSPSEAVPFGPLDGRYRPFVESLVPLLSEYALNRGRIEVEVAWLIRMATERIAGLEPFSAADEAVLHGLVDGFDASAAAELKVIERDTRHDVKAVEYFVKARLAGTSLSSAAELVHFCCTSEDINNLAYAQMVKRAVQQVWLPAAHSLADELAGMALAYRDQPMLSRTHGQPATPTTLGKELAVFAHRLRRQLRRIEGQEYLGKFNGATGTYGAHVVACPDVDWIGVSERFVTSLDLTWNPLTTQIESHDWMAELFADMTRAGSIVHNLATDVWQYISLGYFAQTRDQGSVGSSTMPHKINPIRFENAEANLEVAAGLFGVLEQTLVTSRMQRDLSDSSMLRNIGPAFGHSLVALENVRSGLGGLDVDADALARDLDDAWEVLGEPVQSVMRRAGVERPYERLKELTRGARIDRERLHAFIREQGLDPEDEQRLFTLTPASYTGLADALVDQLERRQ